MLENLGLVFFSCSLVMALWTLLGVVWPKSLLWWAAFDKRSRLRAFAFGVMLTLAFLLTAYACEPKASVWAWLWVLVCGGICCAMGKRFVNVGAQNIEGRKQTQTSGGILYASPAPGAQVLVPSMTSSTTYALDPKKIACSCPDWHKRRRGKSPVFRCCKHLVQYYAENPGEIPPELSRWKRFVFQFAQTREGIPVGSGREYSGFCGTFNENPFIAVGTEESWPWINIYTLKTGSERFGYNMEANRWAYGNSPLDAEEIIEKMRG